MEESPKIDYIAIAKEKGFYAAIDAVETEIIKAFPNMCTAHMANILRLNRSTLAGIMQKKCIPTWKPPQPEFKPRSKNALKSYAHHGTLAIIQEA